MHGQCSKASPVSNLSSLDTSQKWRFLGTSPSRCCKVGSRLTMAASAKSTAAHTTAGTWPSKRSGSPKTGNRPSRRKCETSCSSFASSFRSGTLQMHARPAELAQPLILPAREQTRPHRGVCRHRRRFPFLRRPAALHQPRLCHVKSTLKLRHRFGYGRALSTLISEASFTAKGSPPLMTRMQEQSEPTLTPP